MKASERYAMVLLLAGMSVVWVGSAWLAVKLLWAEGEGK
jgi:hypothetical protein